MGQSDHRDKIVEEMIAGQGTSKVDLPQSLRGDLKAYVAFALCENREYNGGEAEVDRGLFL